MVWVRWNAGVLAALAAFIVSGTSLGVALAAAPSPAAFGRLPGIQDAAISPDGTRLAFLGGSAKNRFVTIATLDSGKQIVASLGSIEVESVTWAGDDYIIIRIVRLLKMHYEGNDARNYHLERDVVVTADGKVLNSLLADDHTSQYMTRLPIVGMMIEPTPTAVVVGLNLEGTRRALWRVDIRTGKGQIVDIGDPTTYSWIVDASGEPRVMFDYSRKDQKDTVLVRPKGRAAWSVLFQEVDAPDVLGYSDPEDAVYVRRDDAQGVRIVRHDLKTGTEQEIAAVPPMAHLGMRWDGRRKTPLAIETFARGQAAYRWLDPKYGAAAAKLDRALPGQAADFVSASKDETRFVVKASAHDKPPAWYLFDATRSELSPIGPSYPELADAALGQTTFFTYRARDGSEIPAFLTLPAAQSGRAPPLIVFPHGGPADGDYTDEPFDWWTQFMAASGYAVLQPQFRGSAGYGRSFENAGRRQWGGKMQTDLLDGVDDLARKGAVDPARVCIVGASFGGYAALAGATLHPGAYRCAVSVNGISDLALLEGEEAKAYGDRGSFERLVGDARDDKALITSTSPIRHIDAIDAPILIVSSAEDTTVKPEQSHLFYDAALRQNKPVTLVTLDGDDHYLHNSATRIRMLEALSAFLKVNLPVSP